MCNRRRRTVGIQVSSLCIHNSQICVSLHKVDDGTGVIDCIMKHPKPSASAEPQKPNSKFTSKADELPPTLPLPLARVGQLVRVQGKVLRSREWFNLRVNEGDISAQFDSCHFDKSYPHNRLVCMERRAATLENCGRTP